MQSAHYLPRPLPPALAELVTLALDLRWSWSGESDRLWQRLDPEIWELTRNPWLILESLGDARLEELAEDRELLGDLQAQLVLREQYLGRRSWYADARAGEPLVQVAYFSMEFALDQALPIYSGGLGVLAGDLLKTASDLGVPIVGVGLLYQQGYFRQALSASGEQLEFFPYNDPLMLPVTPALTPGGTWLCVTLELPGRALRLRIWQAQVGRVKLYLLDSNDPLNAPSDRGITGELYGGGSELRLQQELVLGIGGFRALQALGLDCDVCHLNEGHAAFAVLERARTFMARAGQPFEIALCATRAGNVFTTHTPVASGFDYFPPGLVGQYLGGYAESLGLALPQLLALGRADPDDARAPFVTAYLALRGAGFVNGVSRLHGAVSRALFAPLFPRRPLSEVPVQHVTNGVHVPSWDSEGADALFVGACGRTPWLGATDGVEKSLAGVEDAALWTMRSAGRRQLVESVRRRFARQRAAHGAGRDEIARCAAALDPDVLTLGFARRFTAYKRPNLLLHDPARLARLLGDPAHPVQLILAGKAHPQDARGKGLLRAWSDFLRSEQACQRVVLLEDYDLALAAELVQGVDLWINTPRRPWEASGTSGMKVLVNGGLNLSVLDGWWAEAYAPELGWALPDVPQARDDAELDALQADAMYRLLEQEVVPAYYQRDERGVPAAWVARMRASMGRLTPRFSADRMLREYTERFYAPGAAAFHARAAGRCSLARELVGFRASLAKHAMQLRFGELSVEQGEGCHHFRVQVYLDDLPKEQVALELYADPRDGEGPARTPMRRVAELTGASAGYVYEAEVSDRRPAADYTPRIVPYHPAAAIPLELDFVLWQR